VNKIRIAFDVTSFEFVSEQSAVRDAGWTAYYPFGKNFGDSLSISFMEGEKVRIVSASMDKAYDPLPSRFSEGSLLAEMEREGIGTKATRAETISTLIDRRFVDKSGQELVPTTRGSALIENVREISPEIISAKMTKTLENDLDQIRSGEKIDVDFVSDMLESLRIVMKKMYHMNASSEQFQNSSAGTKLHDNLLLGSCPSCGDGKLELIMSPKTKKRFIRCTNSDDGCRSSSPAYPKGRIIPIKRRCPNCSWPMIVVAYRTRRGTEFCSNYDCTFKEEHS